MSEKLEAARKRAEKHRKAELEAARKRKAAEKLMKDIERDSDTLRKILDGAHIQTEALHNPAIAALLQRLRSEKLVRDRDREVFGLPLLNPEEQQRRGAERAPRRKRKVEAKPPGPQLAPAAVHIEDRETEAA